MRVDLARTHPFDPAVLETPWSYYRELRAEAPVFRDPFTGVFHVASYELVVEVLRDPETYSNRFAPAMGSASLAELANDPELVALAAKSYPGVDTLLTADAPEHKRFRGLVNKAFTPRRVAGIDIAQQAAALVEGFADTGHFEVLSQYSVPLTLTVIADQLGVPRADLPKFKRWTDGFTAQLSGLASGEDALEAARRILEFQHYFADCVEAARAAPREDIVSDLVRARVEGERPLDMAETLSILQQLLVAGNDTTASAIAEGLLLLVTASGAAGAGARDPHAAAEPRRGGAAARDADDQHVAQGEARLRSSAVSRFRPARCCSCASRRPTATRRSSRTPTASTCDASMQPSISRSDTASTSAWAPCSRARRCCWPSKRCCRGSTRCVWRPDIPSLDTSRACCCARCASSTSSSRRAADARAAGRPTRAAARLDLFEREQLVDRLAAADQARRAARRAGPRARARGVL